MGGGRPGGFGGAGIRRRPGLNYWPGGAFGSSNLAGRHGSWWLRGRPAEVAWPAAHLGRAASGFGGMGTRSPITTAGAPTEPTCSGGVHEQPGRGGVNNGFGSRDNNTSLQSVRPVQSLAQCESHQPGQQQQLTSTTSAVLIRLGDRGYYEAATDAAMAAMVTAAAMVVMAAGVRPATAATAAMGLRRLWRVRWLRLGYGLGGFGLGFGLGSLLGYGFGLG